MQAEFINPLIDSIHSVLQQAVNLNSTLGQVFVRTAPTTEDGVGICLGITGHVRGQIVFSMKKHVACEIASIMMMTQVSELDEVSRSAVSELANMIMGTTASNLSEKGFRIDITPPAFLLGENLCYLATSKVKTLCLPFVLDNGSVIEAEIFISREDD